MASESVKDNCVAYAARDTSGVLSPYAFTRSSENSKHSKLNRSAREDDVVLDIKYCGVCHADVVWTKNYHGRTKYPVVPGHEIAGVVREVGSKVTKFKAGDHVGVGVYVNSCRECEYCNEGLEVHCVKGTVYTYDGIDTDGTVTKGGYSSFYVVNERYCYSIPDGYPLELAAPLLCAGISVYTPMMRHNMNQPGKSLGVVGLGGLGHMAVKFGKAFGLKVTVFSTTESKRDEAITHLGADDFVVSSDEQKMNALTKNLDFILNTASGDIPFDPYLKTLKTGGVLVIVGFPNEIKMMPVSLIPEARSIVGTLTGGTKQTQEMLDFCAKNKVYPEVEIVPIDYCNEALARLTKKDVKYRFVLDVANTLKKQ
ncbi:OLC1v1039090C1 [Oldenlandia corymbosa var. corymbosa]|uniref:OLC1v1039090C1 n=1 Tax=Oldenlandia corymbosa var. corymbosa TaxID=529605 RepID=A0AAV1D2A9_OLDCO|nr:OLC1v1039090C1 [Oldenlandia corymbosa var. corymbosa]